MHLCKELINPIQKIAATTACKRAHKTIQKMAAPMQRVHKPNPKDCCNCAKELVKPFKKCTATMQKSS